MKSYTEALRDLVREGKDAHDLLVACEPDHRTEDCSYCRVREAVEKKEEQEGTVAVLFIDTPQGTIVEVHTEVDRAESSLDEFIREEGHDPESVRECPESSGWDPRISWQTYTLPVLGGAQ